jgi:hypothetical protein
MEIGNPPEKEVSPQSITRQELIDLWEMFDAKSGKTQEDHQQFLRDLLEQKERFAHVFKTKRGSTYFVTETGQSFDIQGFKGDPKQENDVWVSYPFEKTFYVTNDETKRLKYDVL